jgi:hypothetical protein
MSDRSGILPTLPLNPPRLTCKQADRSAARDLPIGIRSVTQPKVSHGWEGKMTRHLCHLCHLWHLRESPGRAETVKVEKKKNLPPPQESLLRPRNIPVKDDEDDKDDGLLGARSSSTEAGRLSSSPNRFVVQLPTPLAPVAQSRSHYYTIGSTAFGVWVRSRVMTIKSRPAV